MKSIKTRLSIWLMAGVTIIVAATGLISYSQNRHQDEEDYLAQRSSLKERLSLSLPHGVWQMDDSYTRLTLDAELGWSSVEAIRITGDAGLNIGRARSDNGSLRDMAPSETPKGDDQLQIPIVYQGREKLGTATVYLSKAQLEHRQLVHLLEILLEIVVLDVLIFIAMTFNLNRFVFVPLKQLQDALNQAASSDDAKSSRISQLTDDEFGAVGQRLGQQRRVEGGDHHEGVVRHQHDERQDDREARALADQFGEFRIAPDLRLYALLRHESSSILQ